MDPVTIGALISGGAAIIGGGMSMFGANEQAKATEREGDKNRVVARENLALQKENYVYQQGLQQQIFEREDNATQRRVADLKAAGLSPVLAAGSAANAGAVIKTEAPQSEVEYHDKSAAAAARLQGYIQSAQYAQTFAQIQATAAQTRGTQAQTNLANVTAANFTKTQDAQNRLAYANAAEKEWNTQISKSVGLPTTANSDLSMIVKAFGQAYPNADKYAAEGKRVITDAGNKVKGAWTDFKHKFDREDPVQKGLRIKKEKEQQKVIDSSFKPKRFTNRGLDKK